MFVVEVGSVLTTYSAIIHNSIFAWTITVWLWLTVLFANLAEAVAEGRGKAQAETLRRTKRETVARKLIGWKPGDTSFRIDEVPGTQLTIGDFVVVEAGADHPRRRRRRRGRRLGRRVRHHRRVGPGHPRVRRRPVRGHRRHEGAVGPDHRADHLQARRDVHRPDDRPGRGRVAAEDAERGRAERAARLADADLRDGGRHPAADGLLLQGAAEPDHPGRADRRADPDHHRGAAVGDRHRRHGPAGPAQRAGHVRTRRRGGGRREHAAARQDRHDHHRQPAGDRVPARSAGHRSSRSPTPPSCRRWPTRRRKAAPSSSWRRSDFGIRERGRRRTAAARCSCRSPRRPG